MPDQFIVGVDIGSSKLSSAVAVREQAGTIRYIGHGSAPSAGMRGGDIVDAEGLANSLKRAVEEARYLIGADVQDIALSVSGARIETLERTGGVDLDPNRRIGPADVMRALSDLRGGEHGGVQTIHRVVRSFSIDADPVADPTGRSGRRLDVWVRDFAIPASLVERLRRAADSAGVRIHTFLPEGVAVGSATLSQSERDAGVAVIDIGSATTDIAVYLNGDLQHLAAFPLGGHHITQDVASILSVSIEDAESLKRAHGVVSRDDAEDDLILEWTPRTIAMLQRQASYGNVPPSAIRSITAARVIQIIDRTKEILDGYEVTRRLRAGVVLTGGTAQLDGIVEIARTILGVPVRAGTILAGDGFPAIADPGAAAAVGLTRYLATRATSPTASSSSRSAAATAIIHPVVARTIAGQDTIDVIPRRAPNRGERSGWGQAVRDWLREFIPAKPDHGA